VLNKDENKQHTLPIIIAATDDKSWRVRLALSKIFAEVYRFYRRFFISQKIYFFYQK
jgi:hypothetical protein